MGTLRALCAIRLSDLTDETTSPDRQWEADLAAARDLGAEVINGRHDCEDLDVSASKTDPFSRPALGPWLRRPEAFDAVIWWRFDRAIRSMQDMYVLAQWAAEHKKLLAFAEGLGGTGRLTFDFRNPLDPVAKLLLAVFAFAAEAEAVSIKERVAGAQASIRRTPLRWRGTRPPYGYEPVPMPDGAAGKTLAPDPVTAAVVKRIAAMILQTDPVLSMVAIADTLNSEGIPSPRDYWALRQGRPTGGRTGNGVKGGKGAIKDSFNWAPNAIRKLFQSEAMIGWKVTASGPVRDADGNPVLAATTGILTRGEFDAVNASLDQRAKHVDNRAARSDTNALLLRVAHCGPCGGRLYMHKRRDANSTYRCFTRNLGGKCAAPVNIRADWLDAYAEEEFLRRLGGLGVSRSEVTPGYDPAPELDATLAEYEAVLAQEGNQRSEAARRAWQSRLNALDNRLATLEAAEAVPDTVVTVATGRIYADVWADSDTAGRRAMLQECDVRLTVGPGVRGHRTTLDVSRVTFSIAEGFWADAKSELAAADLD